MKYTNKLNLPKVFVDYFKSGDREIIKNRYSVTELLGSIQQIRLRREHVNEIEQDITESIPALIGTAVHEWLEKNNTEEGDQKEFKFELAFKENTIVGIIDSLNLGNKIIKDYKTCSTSKIQKQDFHDWYLQGMIYAYAIFELYNVKIEKIQFLAIMKDWSKLKAVKSSNYPQSPVYVYEFNPTDTDFLITLKFLSEKLRELNQEREVKCNSEDMWQGKDEYAVYKNVGDKKAVKIFDNEQEAHDYISNKLGGAGIIDIRKGEKLNCKYYCSVREFCKQYKEEEC